MLDTNVHNLKHTDSFCIMPWVSVYTTPDKTVSPCCISVPSNTGKDPDYYKAEGADLQQMANTQFMRDLRLDMLNGVKNPACNNCYKFEQFHESARQGHNTYHSEYMHTVQETQPDGSLPDVKIRYYDFRMDNLCNMKCRSCSAGFSSQWEVENGQHRDIIPTIMDIGMNDAEKYSRTEQAHLLDQFREQVPNIKTAYFAGGEPLMSENHYLLLEEFVRQGRTDIKISYNTNISKFNQFDKDITALWANFEHKIDVAASVDHYGERAEYIRTGTDWSVIETNLLKLNKMENIILGFSTVISLYNYVTLADYMQYMKNLLNRTPEIGFIKCNSPEYLSARTLSQDIKNKYAGTIPNVNNIVEWVNAENYFQKHKNNFKEFTTYTDNVRNTDFCKTFPEIAEMMS